MKIYKKYLLLIFLSVLISNHLTAEEVDIEESQYFSLDLLNESLLLGGGLLLNVGNKALEKATESSEDWSLDTDPEINRVNLIDRQFAFSYSDKLDKASDILTYSALLSPLVLLSLPDTEWFTIGVMYMESLIWTWGLKECGKNLVQRKRPYMYYDGYPEEEIESGDFEDSFPSGHTALAFTGAGFCTFVFSRYYSDSPWKVPVISASYALASGVAVLRIASGCHFATDVITGAVIGTASGFLIPWLHTINYEQPNKPYKVYVIPSGVMFNIKY